MTEGLRPLGRNRATFVQRLRLTLAGFLPAGVFGIVLVLAISAFGLAGGIFAGCLLGAIIAWALNRLIAAYPALQWAAATIVGVVLVLVILSLF